MQLKTYVQISDLHFRVAPQAMLHHTYISLLQLCPWLDGWLGHDPRALAAVEKLFDRLEAGGEQPEVIVTGDLTQVGAPDQFDEAKTFLGGSSAGSQGLQPSLNASDWRERAVPGNHDHWPGYLPVAPCSPSPALHNLFGTGMFVGPKIPLSRDVRLRLIGVNSDHDVPANTVRLFTLGRFEQALQGLPMLQHDPDEVRVLLIHHSPSYQGRTWLPSKDTRWLEIEPASLTALETFVRTYSISVVLTGHIHTYLFVNVYPAGSSLGSNVLEARCGSTTQINNPRARLRRRLGLPTKIPGEPNTAIVHRIFETDSGIEWVAQAYWRNAQNEFVPLDSVNSGGCSFSTGLQVWRRP